MFSTQKTKPEICFTSNHLGWSLMQRSKSSINIFIYFHNLLYFMWPNKQWFSWWFFTYVNIFCTPDFMPFLVYFSNHLSAFVTSSVHFYVYFSAPSSWLYLNWYLFHKGLVVWHCHCSTSFLYCIHHLGFWWGGTQHPFYDCWMRFSQLQLWAVVPTFDHEAFLSSFLI